MDAKKMDELLASTLDDKRLSRGERSALKSVLADAQLNAQRLALFRSRAFAFAQEHMSSRDERLVLEWLEDIIKVLLPTVEDNDTDCEVFFSPGDECLDAIVRSLQNARRTADICVFTITDNRIARPLVETHRRGVQVRVISDNYKSEDLGSDIDRLRAEGVPVRLDNSPHHMHHKFAVFDGRVLINGSYNWTRSAAEHNRENVLITRNPELVRPFQREFDKLWKEVATE